MVRVVFPRQAVNSDIVYRLVTGDCPLAPPQDKQGVLAVPYDYYMVEATLVWDSSGGLRHHHKK